MEHGSGKLLQNLGSDYISRTSKPCLPEKCSMCKFATLKSETLLSAFSSLVSGHSEHEINLHKLNEHWLSAVSTANALPIGNIAAWRQLQEDDSITSQAIKFLKSGQNPPKSNKSQERKKERDFVSKCKLNSKSQLLIKEDPTPFQSKNIERIVVPSWFVKPILTQIHKDQSCPQSSQLRKFSTDISTVITLATYFKQ